MFSFTPVFTNSSIEPTRFPEIQWTNISEVTQEMPQSRSIALPSNHKVI